ncbi:MAG: hypothetical protein COA33_004260 [Fluviicola sp.]|nr:hypothetical protein [Fluviicola sp.]
MKNLLFTLAVVCFSLNFTNAQSSEGHIKYDIDVSSDNPDMAMAVSMMNGAKMEVAFSGKKSFVMMNMGVIMTMKTVTDEDGKVLLLIEGMMGKKAIKSSLEEMEGEIEKIDEKSDVEITLEKETKMVAGYKCKKAIISGDDDTEIIYWYTEKFIVEGKTEGNANGRIPGIALAFELENENGLKMSYTATEVKEEIKDDSIFDLTVPEGFTEMSYEDFKTMGM